MFKFRTILHPTDLDPESAAAYDAAVDLAKLSGGEVQVLYIVPPPAAVTAAGQLSDPADPAVAQGWEEFKARARGAEVPVTPVVLVSDHVNAVARVLARLDAEDVHVIVMATHGRTGLRRLVWGSVAEETVRRARVPVLVVKGHR